MSTDLDCNQVAFFPLSPDHSTRCTAPEGHEGMCWLTAGELMRHKHRKPVPTVDSPFGLGRVGGKHRRPTIRETLAAVNRANAELASRMAAVMKRASA